MGKRIIPQATIRRIWADSDITVREGASLLGLARSTLWKRAKSLGLPPKRNGHPVEFNAPEFPAMWAFGVTAKEIAMHFGIHPDTPTKAARRLSLPARPKGRRTVAEYHEGMLAKAMAETARIEQRQIKLAEMWDQPGHQRSGKRAA